MFVSCPAARFHALCVSMRMPTYTRYVCGSAGTLLSRQRALPRTVCMRQRGHFTLPLSRQRGGTWACLYVGGDGLPDCSAFEFVGVRVRVGRSLSGGPCLRSWGPGVLGSWVLWSCGPAGVFCAVMLSAMHAHDLARLRTTCYPLPRARWCWCRWFFSLFICRWWRWRPGRVGDELARRW